jgi:hypothetical protein
MEMDFFQLVSSLPSKKMEEFDCVAQSKYVRSAYYQ